MQYNSNFLNFETQNRITRSNLALTMADSHLALT